MKSKDTVVVEQAVGQATMGVKSVRRTRVSRYRKGKVYTLAFSPHASVEPTVRPLKNPSYCMIVVECVRFVEATGKRMARHLSMSRCGLLSTRDPWSLDPWTAWQTRGGCRFSRSF